MKGQDVFPIPAGLIRNEPGLPEPDASSPLRLEPLARELGVVLSGPIRSVDPAIFLRRMAPDCFQFQCGEHATGAIRLDCCCQYGADVDLAERDRVLAHRDALHPLLDADRRDETWFGDEFVPDLEFPSGGSVRTNVVRGACVFLGHAQLSGPTARRGCALHSYALRAGLDPTLFKPNVCALYPLTFADAVLCFSADYQDYSCSRAGERAYRLMRPVLEKLFGSALISLLDRAEELVVSEAQRASRDPESAARRGDA